jgi:hypothetical protein
MFGHLPARLRPLVLQETRWLDGVARWSFVGSVPADLAYECSANDPETRTYLFEAAARCGPGIARGIAENRGLTFKTRGFDSEAQAMAAAEEIGARITQVCPLDRALWRTIPLPAEEAAPPAPKRTRRRRAA